jgi:hypothetical protein
VHESSPRRPVCMLVLSSYKSKITNRAKCLAI